MIKIRESFETYIKIDNNNIEIFKNPSIEELKKISLIHKKDEYKRLNTYRAILYKNNLYVADAYDINHANLARALGIYHNNDNDYVPLAFYFEEDFKLRSIQVSDSVSTTKYNLNFDKAKKIIMANPNVRKIAPIIPIISEG